MYSKFGSDKPDNEYYAYISKSAGNYLSAHMACLVQISDVDDGVYLLNPAAVTPDGEWEAWFFANWVPGPRRFPSFAHMMLSEYRSFAAWRKSIWRAYRCQRPMFRHRTYLAQPSSRDSRFVALKG